MKAKAEIQDNIPKVVLTVLRIIVGWHFLYEGLSKLAMPGWSCSSYLMESKLLFSSFSHWIISNPTILAATDFLNIWGLIFIGLGLFIGLFTRLASISGVLMLLMYYIANPPFVDPVAFDPRVKLAIEGVNADGWYLMGEIKVSPGDQ